MIPVNEFSGKKIAVLGLGRTGIAAAKSLMAGGSYVIGWDDDSDKRNQAKEFVDEISDLSRRSMSDLAALVLSPGIPHTLPSPNHIVALAKACDVPVIGDMELLARTLDKLAITERPILLGITGTNGKSTTTALLTHILLSANIDAISGGNIGRAVLDIPKPRQGQVYVVELSSYQLELTSSLRPNVACLLNLSPDHLLRHGTMDNYIAAKKRIFANQKAGDLAVIGVDDPQSAMMVSELSAGPAQVCPISASTVLSRGVYVIDGLLIDAINGQAKQVADLSKALGLCGRHNWQNAAAAYAIARHIGLAEDKIINGLFSFVGLVHRMQPLGKLDNILFVNDSKATNGEAAAKALASFSDIYWIAGGQPKKDGLKPALAFLANVRKAYLIGDAAKQFALELKDHCPSKIANDLHKAFALALADAKKSNQPNPVILLSPACASFDQFKDFEDRGDCFSQLVVSARQEK